MSLSTRSNFAERTDGALPAVSFCRDLGQKLIDNISLAIQGKRQAIALAVTALFCNGHILVEDVPGVGKTVLCRALAQSLGCSFARVQCTSDLLPTDITGVTIFNRQTQEFQFKPGPVFAQVLLADELNRATPKTQSALLECMEERQVTANGQTMPLPSPFLVMATQNPVELEGTFSLPEAQLDRFLLRLSLGYPDQEAELAMLQAQKIAHPLSQIKSVASRDDLHKAQELVRQVYVDEDICRYIIELARRTREHSQLLLGAGPRGTLALYRASQARAAMDGRSFVMPDDVQDMAQATLAHRLIPAGRSLGLQAGRDARRLVDSILADTPIPN